MPAAPLLFAFGIGSPLMLWWAVAAAAPLLIHLLSRRKYRETTWAAMEYLLAAMKRQKRKIVLQQWLLLLLRALLVLLIVAAVAEPYIERLGLVFTPGGRTHRVLVVDASYSMAYKATDQTRFERAKEVAAQILDESAQGDGFTLVQMTESPRIVIGTPGFEPGQVREEIEGLELTHAGSDLPATVAAVRQVIENTRRESPRLDRHEVYFLTDLQRTTWAPSLSEAAMTEFRRQSEELSASASLVVLDLGQSSTENLAVTALRIAEPVVTVGRKVEVEAEVRNFGREDRARLEVEFLVDGRRVEQRQADVAANGQATLKFEYRFDVPGDHGIEIRARGDALEVDNHRWLLVPVRQSIRALCIDGRPSGERFRGATDYLAAALSPQTGHGEHPSVEVDVAAESALLERDLSPYDCVLLANVAQLTASEARVLDAHMGRGGSLVFFLGDQVRADRYNRELAGGTDRPRILPGRVGTLIEKRQSGLDPLGYRHPLVKAFLGREKAGLLTTPVSKYFQLELPEDTKARVALALPNGDPLVVEESIRRGRVVLVATSADTSWTSMPVWPSYLPLVQEILAWCVAGQGRQRNLMVGEPLVVTQPPGSDPAVSVKLPDGQTRPGQSHAGEDSAEWTYDDTLRSGLYTVRFGTPASRTFGFAVNVNTAESDLTPVELDELEGDVWPGIPLVLQSSWQNHDARAAGPIAPTGRLHVDLLYVVLGLLLLETVLAWRFGYHRG